MEGQDDGVSSGNYYPICRCEQGFSGADCATEDSPPPPATYVALAMPDYGGTATSMDTCTSVPHMLHIETIAECETAFAALAAVGLGTSVCSGGLVLDCTV